MAAISYQYNRPTFSDADLAKYPYLAELPERCPCDKIRLWSYKSGHPINEHVKTCVAWTSLQHKRKAAAKEGKTPKKVRSAPMAPATPPTSMVDPTTTMTTTPSEVVDLTVSMPASGVLHVILPIDSFD